MELDNLKPEVAAAIRTMSGEAGGNRDDAYDVIEAELLRLAEFESELAALKARIAEAPVAVFEWMDGLEWRLNDSTGGVTKLSGNPVRLLLDE